MPDTAGGNAAPGASGVSVHVLAPAAGSVETATSPAPNAAHNDVDGQETSERAVSAGSVARLQARCPTAGLVEVAIVPWLPTATHSVAVGHAMPLNEPPGISLATCHALAPPAGFVDQMTEPALSTATHSWTDGQASEAMQNDTSGHPPRLGTLQTTCATLQFLEPRAGRVEVATLPP